MSVLAVLAGLLAWRPAAPVVDWSPFSDRDLVRGARFLDDLPTTGAELTGANGARIPGGLQYALTAAAQAFGDHPFAVQRVVLLLDTVGLGLLAAALGRAAGGGGAGLAAAATATGVWLGAEVVPVTVLQAWNPAWMPFFLALATVGLHEAAATGRRRGFALLGLGLGAAAQLHLSTSAVTLAAVLALIGTRGLGALPGLGLAAMAAVATFLPHLVDEALHGWPNTTRLLDEPYVAEAVGRSPVVQRLRQLGDAAGALTGVPLSPRWPSALGPVASAPWVAFVVGAGAADRRARAGDATAQGTLAVAATVLLALLLIVLRTPQPQTRYFYVLLPGFAWVGGYGVAALARAAAAGWRAASVPAVVLLLAGAVNASWWVERAGGWTAFHAPIEALRARTGWSLAEVAARTLYGTAQSDGVVWRSSWGIDDDLRRAGQTFPGSGPPPCAVVLDVPVTEDLLAANLPADGVPPRLLDAWGAGFTWFALYDPGRPHCPTSLTNRYLDTEAEASIRPWLGDLAPDGAVRLPDTGRFAVGLAQATSDGRPLYLAVDLDREADGLRVTLHANQLRNREAWNAWWGPWAVVERPRLVFEVDGAPVAEVAVADGRVGGLYASTPVVAHGAAPPAGAVAVLELGLVRADGTVEPRRVVLGRW